MTKFESGERVVDIKTGKLYDFGYVSQTGHAVCYEPGECNMQDATAIPPEEILRVSGDTTNRVHYAGYRWIKVKRYTMDESLSWEDRYKQLEEHHRKETEFLIAEVRKLAEQLDSR